MSAVVKVRLTGTKDGAKIVNNLLENNGRKCGFSLAFPSLKKLVLFIKPSKLVFRLRI